MKPLDAESTRLLRQVLRTSKGPAFREPKSNSKPTAHRKTVDWLRKRGANPRDYVIKIDANPTADAPRTVRVMVIDDGKLWRVLTLQTSEDGMVVIGDQASKVYDRVGLRVRLSLSPLMEGA
jgi:hypothetical protein